ncbi:MAG: CAP domain-containing protein, partial [Candidatus Gottesmanbacteria bacterium]|nr:CAP domain-containing protein [Candidatus Gottesmanbacteria bacterium]
MSLVTSLRHFFIPHQTNNHRAKALHVDMLLAYVLLFALFNLGIRAAHKVMPDILGYATDINVQQLLADTNAKRQEAGLSPVTLNNTLSVAAANKAADMFVKNYWAHNSPAGATPWDFITGAGYHYTVAGENLAKNFSTSGGVVDAWMASPSHRENLLKAGYRDVGLAVVNGTLAGEETTLVV